MVFHNRRLLKPTQPFVASGGISAPTDIAGCIAWYDASNAGSITIVVGVSQWNDLSGVGNTLTQATTTAQPTIATSALNGKDTLLFTAALSQVLIGSGPQLQSLAGWTILVVGKSTDVTNIQNFFFVPNGSSAIAARAALNMGTGGAGKIGSRARRANADAGVNVTSASAFGTGYGYFTAIGDYTNTTGTIRENGSQTAQSTSWLTAGITPADGSANIGAGGISGFTQFLDGNIAEIVVYDSALSGTNLTNIETFLKNKWDL